MRWACRLLRPMMSISRNPICIEAHDALICIAEGAYVDQQQPRRRRLTPQHYFKIEARDGDAVRRSARGVGEHVSKSLGAVPLRPKKRKPILPRFAEDEVEELRRQANGGVWRRGWR